MSDHDPFSNLLGALRRQRRSRNADIDFGKQTKTGDESGLNPLDLLSLPAEQRDLINFLSRQKQASLAEIQAKIQIPLPALSAALDALVREGYVHRVLLHNEIYYRVVFGGKVKRGGRGIPQTIWDAVDLDNSVFLRQVSLFEHLTDEERHQIANLAVSQHYKRHEVILWQGQLSENIYIIKNGIVGISRLKPDERHTDETEILAYLKQGDLLGEHNLSAQHNLPSLATATALSEVELLRIHRNDFMEILLRYESVALKLAKMLGERLLDLNRRLGSKGGDVKLSVIIDTTHDNLVLGPILALALAQTTQRRAVYAQLSSPSQLIQRLGLSGQQEIYTHPEGFDIAAIEPALGLPSNVQTTLIVDRLLGEYANVVVGLTSPIDENALYALEKAHQVIILGHPQKAQQLQRLLAQVRTYIHPERANLIIVAQAEEGLDETSMRFDYVLPDVMPADIMLSTLDDLPDTLAETALQLAYRLGRTHQIGVYIPTTIDVDKAVDTTSYIERTQNFLKQLFGDVMTTSDMAQGVWNSEEVGLVSEAIHIVRTFVTQATLERFLGDVLEYVESLKEELSQEAMAIEVNQKLMLI